MARVACVPSELGSAAGFPKETIIPQKPPPTRSGVLAGRGVLYPPHSMPLLSPDGQCLPNWSTPGLAIRK